MRAALVSELGQLPELAERPEPDGDALVEIVAAPLNPIDIAVGAGRFFGGHPELPYVPGAEAVGRTADGALVWIFAAGIGTRRDGVFAERVAVPPDALHPVPDGADPAVAGACGIAGLAGWLPVAWRAPVREGETVLVLGATGTVGLVAVQAARLHGAGRVVAAGRSEERLRRAEELGADATVHLGGEDDLENAFREACGGDGPNLIVDPLWGEPAAAAVKAAAPRARIVQLGQSAGPEATLASGAVRGKQLDILGHTNFAVPREELDREYERLVRATTSGEVVIDVERIPFENVADAWRRQAEGPRTKLVLVP